MNANKINLTIMFGIKAR